MFNGHCGVRRTNFLGAEMKLKTSELTGAALDWAVAKCENRIIGFNLGGGLQVRARTEEGAELPDDWDLWYDWHPSTGWSQGGPIIEREKINLEYPREDYWVASKWMGKPMDFAFGQGETALIAAMRCYVASKLGDEMRRGLCNTAIPHRHPDVPVRR